MLKSATTNPAKRGRAEPLELGMLDHAPFKCRETVRRFVRSAQFRDLFSAVCLGLEIEVGRGAVQARDADTAKAASDAALWLAWDLQRLAVAAAGSAGRALVVTASSRPWATRAERIAAVTALASVLSESVDESLAAGVAIQLAAELRREAA